MSRQVVCVFGVSLEGSTVSGRLSTGLLRLSLLFSFRELFCSVLLSLTCLLSLTLQSPSTSKVGDFKRTCFLSKVQRETQCYTLT